MGSLPITYCGCERFSRWQNKFSHDKTKTEFLNYLMFLVINPCCLNDLLSTQSRKKNGVIFDHLSHFSHPINLKDQEFLWPLASLRWFPLYTKVGAEISLTLLSQHFNTFIGSSLWEKEVIYSIGNVGRILSYSILLDGLIRWKTLLMHGPIS